FFYQAPYVFESVSAVIVTTIGYEQECPALVAGGSHPCDRQINRIEQGSVAVGIVGCKLLLYVFDRLGRAAQESRLIGKGDDKVIVLGICVLKELLHGGTLGNKLIGHALAQIQDQSDREGWVFG